ncbi:hypothetical protein ACQUJK_002822 [Enterococcus hirae]
MTTGKFSLSDRLYTFGVWVTQVDYCIRLLREYKEEGRTFDMQAFLNHNLSCGMNDQFSEKKRCGIALQKKNSLSGIHFKNWNVIKLNWKNWQECH